jgi:hypothetical protein
VTVKPSAGQNPGRTLGSRSLGRLSGRPSAGLVDLIEQAAVGEEGRLGLAPAAEVRVDVRQRELGEARAVLGQRLRIARPIVVLGDDVLRLGRVEEFR